MADFQPFSVGMVNSYREEEGGEKSLPSLFTGGLVKDGSRMLTSPLFYRGGKVRFFFFFQSQLKCYQGPPEKPERGLEAKRGVLLYLLVGQPKAAHGGQYW